MLLPQTTRIQSDTTVTILAALLTHTFGMAQILSYEKTRPSFGHALVIGGTSTHDLRLKSNLAYDEALVK
jgi:hypothetical protein